MGSFEFFQANPSRRVSSYLDKNTGGAAVVLLRCLVLNSRENNNNVNMARGSIEYTLSDRCPMDEQCGPSH